MNFRVKALILAGALLGAAALVPAVSEGRGGNAGGRGQCGQTQQQCRQQNPNCPQDGQQTRDGSCGNAACPQQGGQRAVPRSAGTRAGRRAALSPRPPRSSRREQRAWAPGGRSVSPPWCFCSRWPVPLPRPRRRRAGEPRSGAPRVRDLLPRRVRRQHRRRCGGTIIDIQTPAEGPVRLVVAGERERWVVLASPAWFWKSAKPRLVPGDSVTVRGSKTLGADGTLYLVAREIRPPAPGRPCLRDPAASRSGAAAAVAVRIRAAESTVAVAVLGRGRGCECETAVDEPPRRCGGSATAPAAPPRAASRPGGFPQDVAKDDGIFSAGER